MNKAITTEGQVIDLFTAAVVVAAAIGISVSAQHLVAGGELLVFPDSVRHIRRESAIRHL